MPRGMETGVLTVAAVRKPTGAKITKVLFHEREQIFTLPSRSSTARALARQLRAALDKKVPIKATLDPRRGLVRRIDAPTERELRKFERLRISLEKPQKTVRVNVKTIDPITFNIVGRYLKFPIFKLCKKVIPTYKTAKKIFDYCAKQSCHLPGPPNITPCIPFQYVIDGCYARAHKMRKIIEEKYGYCCEKVFSFATQNNDDLAVQANKWGGCCVFWWYHVAPLVRVRIKIFGIKLELALVIDPSMFDKPVLLSTWLAAQENTACASNAKVSIYSIQPGSAYWPTNFAGTTFGTDPNYVSTDATCIAYKNLTTC